MRTTPASSPRGADPLLILLLPIGLGGFLVILAPRWLFGRLACSPSPGRSELRLIGYSGIIVAFSTFSGNLLVITSQIPLPLEKVLSTLPDHEDGQHQGGQQDRNDPKDPEMGTDYHPVGLLPIKNVHAADRRHCSGWKKGHGDDANGLVRLCVLELGFHPHVLIVTGLFAELCILQVQQRINLSRESVLVKADREQEAKRTYSRASLVRVWKYVQVWRLLRIMFAMLVSFSCTCGLVR